MMPSGICEFLQPDIRVLFPVCIIALQLFLLSYTVFPSFTFMVSRLLQPLNVSLEIEVALSGIVRLVKLVQSLNAESPIEVMPSGMVKSAKLVHPLNAQKSTVVILSGRERFANLVHPSNALLPI